MPIATTYRAAVEQLARYAGPDNPPYVAVQAACRLVNELSPNNPNHENIMRILNAPQPDSADTVVTTESATDEDDEASNQAEHDDPL